MLKVLGQTALYNSYYHLKFPKIMPANFTISILYTCNSRCKTCNVWKKRVDNLTVEEYDKIFHSVGHDPYWITISGGEPFLRADIDEIAKVVYQRSSPGILNIPTNGLLTRRIPEKVEAIARSCPKQELVINLSLDGVGEEHDEIRGVKGNFKRSLETWAELKKLQKGLKNLTLGVHTVISVYNVKRIAEIEDYLVEHLEPNNFISEIAEERIELATIGTGITPLAEDYEQAVSHLQQKIRQSEFKGVARISQAFRYRYYNFVKQYMYDKRQIIPCKAGVASTHIAPDGNVWGCCIRAESLGNLRDHDYNFPKIWFNQKADAFRRSVKNKECHCPLANASYTNMLAHYPTLAAVGTDLLLNRYPKPYTQTKPNGDHEPS